MKPGEQVGPQLLINDIDVSDRPAHQVIEVLFLCIDFTYSSMETIQENLKEMFSLAVEYLTDRKLYSKDTKDRCECGRLMRLIGVWRVKWQRLDREGLIRQYWDFILRNQHLSQLPGFGVSTTLGDRLMVNPEKKTLRSIVKT